jgi:hypothetical protein
MTRGPLVMVKREKRALSGFLIRHLGSVGALRGQLRSDGQRCELVVIDRRCSARGHRFGWMSTLLSRADADPNGRRAQRIGAWSTANWCVDAGSDGQQVGLEKTDCSLIVDQTMGSQRPPQGQLVSLRELLGFLQRTGWRAGCSDQT